jgi:sterol 3beta-glucosyltransferase
MLITIVTAGSQGDIQPYLALAMGLKNEGFQVRLAANINFAGLIASHGLDYFPIQVDSHQLLQTPQAQQAWLESDSLLKLSLNTARAIRPAVPRIFDDVLDACKDSDLIIYHSYNLPFVYYIGKLLDIPFIPASLHPMPTREHITPPLNIKKSPGRSFNLLSHLVAHQFSWQLFMPVARKAWGKRIHVSVITPVQHIRNEGRLVLCAYSPTVIPRPADVPETTAITGYWFLDSAPNWKAPADLVAFIQSGSPPIYVGFGSNPVDKQATLDLILDALAITGKRAVMASGWGGLGTDHPLPDHVFLTESAPHQWLLPQMAAIVHHGGAGTTGAALSAGVPNFVVPHFGDQFFWGRRVAELGVGPAPLAHKTLSVERLAQAITAAVKDEGMKERARMIGGQIRAEDGIRMAIQKIRQFVG